MKQFQRVLINTVKVVYIMLTVIFALVAPLLFFSARWMFQTWNHLTMDELVFHLNSPLEGTNTDMIKEYLLKCLLPSVVIFLIVIILLIIVRKKKVFYVVEGFLLVGMITLALGTVIQSADRLDLKEYLANQGKASDFIDTHYVDPADVTITFPEQKRNLIYIFLESMETTYADRENGGAFQENVIPELTKIAEENEDFSGDNSKLNGAYMTTGTTWTMGAMFAHTSGLPLNISIGGNDMDTQDHFFPGIITLGDILENEGYSQTLLIGSDATFGGRRLYFTEHGHYDMIDHPYALENGLLPEGYHVWWGYEDLHLFDFAKEKLEELSSQDTPFNLTMLTVDTHFEDGYVCSECQDTYGDDQYSNVMACSSRQLDEFLQWIQEQDFYEDTTIVLAGDHLTMDSNYCEDVAEDYERKAYVSYINPAVACETSEERVYTTMDHFPTTLAAMGAQIEGDRLGLGTNLFSSTPTLAEMFGIDQVDQELQRKSELMEEMASIDKNTEALKERSANAAPTASMSIEEYQDREGTISVTVSDIENVEAGVESVQIAVWTQEDQSDLRWIPMQELDEETYKIDVPVQTFSQTAEEFQIHAYVIDEDGNQNILATGTATIK